MAGLAPAIHVLGAETKQAVYARDKRRHDELTRSASLLVEPRLRLFRLQPAKFRQLVPEPGELPLGILAGIGAAGLRRLLPPAFVPPIPDYRPHPLILPGRPQRIAIHPPQ